MTDDPYIPADRPTLPADGEIHVWRIDNAPDEDIRRLARMVSRELLAACLSCATDELRLSHGPHGKPRLAMPGAPPLAWNLSHGPDVAVVALSTTEVGIDIENRNRQVDALRLARRYFHEHEIAWLAECDGDDRRLAFLRLWTRKEALLKCLGHGLAYGLGRFSCIPAHDDNAVILEDGNRRPVTLYLHDPAPVTGAIISLATPIESPRLRHYLWHT